MATMTDLAMRRLGPSGLSVSVVGVGCNNFGRRLDADGATRVVHAALDAGVNLFDTADIYGGGASEEILGKALEGRRDRAVVATKFGGAMGDSWRERGASRRWIRLAVEASLRRLRTDWIDLYQMHFPDPATPIDETLAALDDLVHAGLVRYIGSSNLSGWEIADAEWTARTGHLTRFVSAQNQYSLLERDVEREATPACARYGIGLIPYYPLAAGVLTGKYSRDARPPADTRLGKVPELARQLLTEHNFDVVDALRDFASARQIRLVDVAIGWLAAQPQVASVIAGAMTPEQVHANVAAAGWTPSDEDLDEIDRIAPGPAG
jgi:aryl-alcohol dehydrogenase-like predicted oxidoreductase